MTLKPWKRFFFESNLFFDHIENMSDWQRLCDAYPKLTDTQLLDAKEATYGGHRTQQERDERPNYGFRLEHDGKRTLRDFFAKHGMELDRQTEAPALTSLSITDRNLRSAESNSHV